MLFFDGVKQTCVKFRKTKVGLRCADFEKASKVGKHPCLPKGGLKGGGRSQWAIRGGAKKKCSSAVEKKSRRK